MKKLHKIITATTLAMSMASASFASELDYQLRSSRSGAKSRL